MADKFFDPEQRRLEKQQAREKDDADLRAGKVSAEELQRRNGFFSSLDISKAKIVRRSLKNRSTTDGE